MKKNTVKLNENALRRIIAESVKNTLKEVSDKTLANALDRSHNLNRILEKVSKEFETLGDSLASLAGETPYYKTTTNKEFEKICYDFNVVWDRFKKLYDRKWSQLHNFGGEWEDRDFPEVD